MIGETLGQYRIETRLGAGGMGVVYRARDERLHRTVAIKVVGGKASGSTPDERAQLLDEARAASHLNHPHICTVYEVGEIDGRFFIAMEFVEGRPISELLPADGLPTELVIRYGEQIAAAIAHAHERGVIHRDLKTANVVVNPASGAKVLDFGLAHRMASADVDAKTQSISTADPSVLLGTLAYIAPEVLLGRVADARTDTWSLGVVLYEMATGQLPFQGRTTFDLTAAILRSPPQPFPAHVPPILRSIILRCLAKEPEQRYQRAGEARAALEAIQSDLIVAPPIEPTQRRRVPYLLVGGIAVGVVLLAIAGWVLSQYVGRRRTDVPAPGKLTRAVSSETSTFDPAISPDGRMLTYIAEDASGQLDLFAGRIFGGAKIRLTNDRALERSPRFSPDGENIAFTVSEADGSATGVRIVPALGGVPLATIPEAANAAWSPDGRRLAYLRRRADGQGNDLVVSAVDGSDATVILPADSKYPFPRNPAWSPDGRTIAVVRGSGGIAAEIWLVPSAGGPPRPALSEPQALFSDWPSFTSDGRGIVHASNRGGATNIWWLPLSGAAPVRLTTGSGPDESPSVARDGTIAYVNSRSRDTLETHDIAGGVVRTLLTHTPFIWGPAISPDGREVVFSRGDVDGSWHLWALTLADGAVRQITSGQAGEVYGRYAPDGQSLYFHTWNAPRRIGRLPRAGGPVTWLPVGDQPVSFAEVSPDGKRLAFVRTDTESERIYVTTPQGGSGTLLTHSRGTVPRWSPDGRTIAFAGDRGFEGGIFVIGADGTGERRLTKEGGWPVWWPDGRQIGYVAVGRDGKAQIRVRSLQNGSTRTLDRIRLGSLNHPFAVTPDGKQILVGNTVHVMDEVWVMETGPAR